MGSGCTFIRIFVNNYNASFQWYKNNLLLKLQACLGKKSITCKIKCYRDVVPSSNEQTVRIHSKSLMFKTILKTGVKQNYVI